MSVVDWLFRDRRTGRIVIAQWPNAPLWIFMAAGAVARFAEPSGSLFAAARLVAALALTVWAGDELARGVNPWRRVLGGAVLIGLAIRLLA